MIWNFQNDVLRALNIRDIYVFVCVCVLFCVSHGSFSLAVKGVVLTKVLAKWYRTIVISLLTDYL